jgi:hypothetical protein
VPNPIRHLLIADPLTPLGRWWRLQNGRPSLAGSADKRREIPSALLDRVRSLASTTAKHRDSINARHGRASRGEAEQDYDSDDSDE